ncbi:hypothetical protein MPC1_15460002 [Methylocella tundrae]|nr:hypothetical protein MPC1_15460002 [Methylocella tundrae]
MAVQPGLHPGAQSKHRHCDFQLPCRSFNNNRLDTRDASIHGIKNSELGRLCLHGFPNWLRNVPSKLC